MSNEWSKQKINNMVDMALHQLQADGTVDRGGIAALIRELQRMAIASLDEKTLTVEGESTMRNADPMTAVLGYAYEMEEVKSWPVWLADYSVVEEAAAMGWIVEIRKEPFIPRLGKSFIISGLSSAGRSEFLRRVAMSGVGEVKTADGSPAGALSIETVKTLGSEQPTPVRNSQEVWNTFMSGRQTAEQAICDAKSGKRSDNYHEPTDECGFDRNASHSEDTYVCTCGWRTTPK